VEPATALRFSLPAEGRKGPEQKDKYMRKLTKFVAPALFAALTLGAVTPALAQHRTPQRTDQIRAQISELQQRVNRNDRRDRISQRESVALRRDVANLQATFRSYNRNGLNNAELRTLNARIDNIRTRLHIERRDWNNRRW
jgi:septal ring factor EnvC (AmiA/AmiB activator)